MSCRLHDLVVGASGGRPGGNPAQIIRNVKVDSEEDVRRTPLPLLNTDFRIALTQLQSTDFALIIGFTLGGGIALTLIFDFAL